MDPVSPEASEPLDAGRQVGALQGGRLWTSVSGGERQLFPERLCSLTLPPASRKTARGAPASEAQGTQTPHFCSGLGGKPYGLCLVSVP